MKKSTESVTLSYDHNRRPIGFEVIEYDSEKAGPTVFLQASVHGAELQGNLVIQELASLIEQEQILKTGKIILVPYANPWGSQELFGAGTYGRFDPITGKNWNRAYHYLYDEEEFKNFAKKNEPSQCHDSFKSLLDKILQSKIANKQNYGMTRASQLTYELQKRSHSADIFLDLHTAPKAGLYVYAPDFLKEKVKDLHYPINLIIPAEFADAGDEAHFSPWAKIKEAFLNEGKEFQIPTESYTLELGGEEFVDRKLAKQQLNHILNLLNLRGVTSYDIPNQWDQSFYQDLDHFKTFYAPFGGLCEYLAKPGELIQSGDPLAKISYYNRETQNFDSIPITAKSPSLVVNHFSTSNVQAGTEIYQVLENPLNY